MKFKQLKLNSSQRLDDQIMCLLTQKVSSKLFQLLANVFVLLSVLTKNCLQQSQERILALFGMWGAANPVCSLAFRCFSKLTTIEGILYHLAPFLVSPFWSKSNMSPLPFVTPMWRSPISQSFSHLLRFSLFINFVQLPKINN